MVARSARAVLPLLVLIACVPSGCRRIFTASHADPEKARAILRQGLDAWKNGESMDSIQSSASITFVDSQWKKGLKLIKYEVSGDGTAFGHDWQCKVKLSVKDDKGEKSVNAVYNISTSPKLVVVRSEVR